MSRLRVRQMELDYALMWLLNTAAFVGSKRIGRYDIIRAQVTSSSTTVESSGPPERRDPMLDTNNQGKRPQAKEQPRNSSGQDLPRLLGGTLKTDSLSYLRQWLAGFNGGVANHQARTQAGPGDSESWRVSIVPNPDPDHSDRQKRWEEIGWEVFERKALLLAAAKDLQDNGCSNPVKLAAADVFVEKAQNFLTDRGTQLSSWAKITP